jgi:hypothetical protein
MKSWNQGVDALRFGQRKDIRPKPRDRPVLDFVEL